MSSKGSSSKGGAGGPQKSILGFFTKVPAGKAAPAPKAAAGGKSKEPSSPTKAKGAGGGIGGAEGSRAKAIAPKPKDSAEDPVMVCDDDTKNTPPASQQKKRKEPERDTPVQPADDKRSRMDANKDEDEDEDLAPRKSTRRRVVPTSLAESSDDDAMDEDYVEEKEEEEEEKKEAAPQRKQQPAPASKPSAAPAAKPAAKRPGTAIMFGGKSRAAPVPKPAAQPASTAANGRGGAVKEEEEDVMEVEDEEERAEEKGKERKKKVFKGDPDDSEEEDPEKARIHKKFAQKVSLVRRAPDQAATSAAEASQVGGKLEPGRLVWARGAKLTPFEDQVVSIKNKHPDTVLMVECGYKFKFLGRDAEIASRVLNIFHHMDHSFFVASIPVQRVNVHCRRLVEAGYKVGIVRQTENAALKAVSDSKNKQFARELCEVYTKSTMIVEDVHVLESHAAVQAQAGAVYMMCVCEGEVGEGGEVEIGVVAVDTGSGDIVYDAFIDDALRSQLETRVSHLQPKELLLADDLSTTTTKLLKRMAVGSQARTEGISGKHLEAEQAEKVIRQLFQSHKESDGADTEAEVRDEDVGCVAEGRVSEKGLEGVLSLPQLAMRCIGGMLFYLKQFNLHQVLRLTGNMWRFSSRTHMLLDAQVLTNLEVVGNDFDGSEEGSLVWLLKATKTSFGARLLKHWIAHPLVDRRRIEDRHSAVEELIEAPLAAEPIAKLLKGLPDLERAVARIHYGKCAPNELLALLKALARVSSVAKEAQELSSSLSSSLLRSLIADWPDHSSLIEGFLDEMDHAKAAEAKGINFDKKELLRGFARESEYPDVFELRLKAREVKDDLQGHLVDVRRMLRLPDLEYKSILTTTYLIEVPLAKCNSVPKDWEKVNGTKTHSRFHSPEVLELTAKMARVNAKLDILCADAWSGYLSRVAESYGSFKNVVQRLAVLDCLMSLAAVAKRGGWIRPRLSDDQVLKVIKGRHPMVDAKMGSGFVPNDIHLGQQGEYAMVITGPNMGGKSSYIRQNALIVIMSQIGSFVPAEAAELGVFDAVYTRMGASDCISSGRSTFLVETQEAADIMRRATSKSLVIMDELGRGTSTHDGTAIAYATLRHLVTDVRCFALFVTHYQPLCQMTHELRGQVGNYHMSFMEEGEGEHKISFMYRLVKGRADRSFGLNVASMANLPDDLVQRAKLLSAEMEAKVDERMRGRLSEVFKQVFALAGGDDIVEKARALCGEARGLVTLGKR